MTVFCIFFLRHPVLSNRINMFGKRKKWKPTIVVEHKNIYDHTIKRLNKCTCLSNDDYCVKQTKNKTPYLKKKKKKKGTQKSKTKSKTKETPMAILFTKRNKVFLQATWMYITKGSKRCPE